MKNITKKITALMMATALLSTACARQTTHRQEVNNRNSDIEFNTAIDYSELEQCSYEENQFSEDYNAYSFELMSQVLANEASDSNVMISPASIMFALDMTSAGANGETLRQIVDLFSEGADPLEQHAFAADMMNRINDSEGVEFSCANAVWANETFLSSGFNPDYEDYIQEYFNAEINEEAFGLSTVSEINDWVDEHTSGMIDKVLDQINPETAAVLVNAIAFEGEWASQYEDYEVNEMDFTNADGQTSTVQMLCRTENFYFENSEATGFINYYEGGQYAFLVMLPTNESISANEFLMNFDGDDYAEFVSSRTNEYDVYTRLPEFEYDYDTNLNDVLEALGVETAFDEDDADFSGIAIPDNGLNLCISDVIHKTHIELDRNGTRAAAVTVVLMDAAGCPMPDETQIREVYCDRPFAYAIVDTSTMNPIFLGTYNG